MGAKRSNIVGSTNIVQQRWNVYPRLKIHFECIFVVNVVQIKEEFF